MKDSLGDFAKVIDNISAGDPLSASLGRSLVNWLTAVYERDDLARVVRLVCEIKKEHDDRRVKSN